MLTHYPKNVSVCVTGWGKAFGYYRYFSLIKWKYSRICCRGTETCRFKTKKIIHKFTTLHEIKKKFTLSPSHPIEIWPKITWKNECDCWTLRSTMISLANHRSNSSYKLRSSNPLSEFTSTLVLLLIAWPMIWGASRGLTFFPRLNGRIK